MSTRQRWQWSRLVLLFLPTIVALAWSAQAAPPSTSGSGIASPTYTNYAATKGLGNNGGEPSIGVNWRSGSVMLQAGLQTLLVNFDDASDPATAKWRDRSTTLTSQATFDPILFTDHETGRTFVAQLLGKTSLQAFTDDDGNSYTPSDGAPGSGVDHETIGGGIYVPNSGLPLPTQSYTHAVYYCSQDVADAYCARSDTGGLTYNNPVPTFTAGDCDGQHGHVKVAPNDGTVYVPNANCLGLPTERRYQAVVVSTDNGLTWSVRIVPSSHPGVDPSIGIGAKGTLYFGFQDGIYDLNGTYLSSHPKIAVSHDRGLSWSFPYDVGAQFGIQNSVFPTVVAGDDDRAAFAFLGTQYSGNYQDAAHFPGLWHLYIATTVDGGQNWTTVDATPNDPVQRGSICTAGTSCSQNRNLLDFIDSTVDRTGRVLVAYADGCIGPCVAAPPNSDTALATIARQSSGPRLFHRFDANLLPTPTAIGTGQLIRVLPIVTR